MKCLPLLIALIFLTNTTLANSSTGPKPAQIEPYLFCNVFLADGCFGIAAGDRVTMQIVTDFVLYDLVFASGKRARLYSGFNPSVIDGQGEKFRTCEWHQDFGDCATRTLDDGRVEFLARRNKKSTVIHVVIDAGIAPRVVNSFLRNIRPCVLRSKTIRCI